MSRAVLHRNGCDECNNVIDLVESRQGGFPDSWVALQINASPEQNKIQCGTVKHFCGWRCAGIWVSKQELDVVPL